MANWWGPIANKQGIYLLKAVVPPEPLTKEKGRNLAMVQDLQIINEAVVPLHPTVPNPNIFLLLSGRPQEKNTNR